MKTYNVRSSVVRRLNAHLPVKQVTVIPSILGFPGWSDEVTLQPGERLEIIRSGSPESWSQAVIVPVGVPVGGSVIEA